MNRHLLLVSVTSLAILCFFTETIHGRPFAQEPTPPSAEKGVGKPANPAAPENPAQIELLETGMRFEADGSSRKVVHARVHINSELGVRQFARLNFDYHRAFENVEIPFVRITHSSGGTVDILPSAITDSPNPAVVNAPAFQDVRVKSVRILGLAPSDTLEYRVITTVSHHPLFALSADIWLDHSFDRTGLVSQEIFELDLPASKFEDTPPTAIDPPAASPGGVLHSLAQVRRSGRIYISPETPETSKERNGEYPVARIIYKWTRNSPATASSAATPAPVEPADADIAVSTLTWQSLASLLQRSLYPYGQPPGGPGMQERSREILSGRREGESDLEAIYRFVSQKIKTVDLPLGSTGFRLRNPLDVYSSGYGTAEEKAVLFLALLPNPYPPCDFALFVHGNTPEKLLPSPSLLTHILLAVGEKKKRVFLDPAAEVAPFGVITADLRGKMMLMLNKPGFGQPPDDPFLWQLSTRDLPFASSQRVNVNATLAADGKLTAKVHYSMRGDNELLLRVALHQAPKEKWKDLAQLLALSDGFRGRVTSVTASDPSATREPFTLDYEITTPQFADWSRKPVRIPALLPQIGLPDPPAKPSPGAARSLIELGTPLEVETHMTLHLPPGTTVHPPTGTSVQRDYATFASQYSAKGPMITASRHINFLLREVPTDRAADYNAFLHAVQNDEAQDFTLDREDTVKVGKKPDAPKLPAAPRAVPPKP